MKKKKTKLSLRAQAVLLITGAAIASTMYFIATKNAHAERDALAMLQSYTSALVISLDGNPATYTGLDRGIHFDHNANGFAQKTGWVGENTALLVQDLDGDGTIRNGLELIGGNARVASGLPAINGLHLLRELDSNGDGVINHDDHAWDLVSLWYPDIDRGIARNGRLVSMAAAGIRSISLEFVPDGTTNAYGNTVHSRAIVTMHDGSTTDLIEVEFSVDHARAKPLHLVEVPDHIKRLPNHPGLGTLHDIHQAMAQDQTGYLEQAVESFTQERSPSARHQLTDEILHAWAGVTEMDPASRGAHIDARHLAVVEASNGKAFLQQGKTPNPRPNAARILMEAYDTLHDSVYSTLLLRSHLRRYIDQIEFVIGEKDAQGRYVHLSAAQLPQLFTNDRQTDRGWALDNLLEFNIHARKAVEIISQEPLKLTEVVLPWIIEDLANGYAPFWDTSELAIRGMGKIEGSERDEVLIGTRAGDRINANGGNNLVVAGPGGNHLHGGTGQTIYLFGPGEDTALSRRSDADDIYILRRGDSINTIKRNGGTGRILLAPDIHPDQVKLVKDETDMVLMVDTGEKLIVSGAYNRSGRLLGARAISEIVFQDGVSWKVTQ